MCATVDSQCLEYLGCITLAPGCHPPQEKWATRNFERNFHKSGHPDKLAQPFEKISEHLPRACTKTEKWRKTTWPVCSLHQLEKLPHSGVYDTTDCDSKSLVTGCLFWQLFSNVWKRQSGWVGLSKCYPKICGTVSGVLCSMYISTLDHNFFRSVWKSRNFFLPRFSWSNYLCFSIKLSIE